MGDTQKVFGSGRQTESPGIQDALIDVEMKEQRSLEVIEVDILTQSVLKRFNVPDIEGNVEIDSRYNDEIVERGHGYHLYFCNADNHSGYLIVSMPNACVAIFDHLTSQLLFVFKADSKIEIIHSKFFTNPSIPGTIFWVTDKLTIYKLNTLDLLTSTNTKKPQKLKFGNDIMINEIQVHPSLPLLFVACADGIIRVWNYDDLSEYAPFRLKDKQICSMTALNFTLKGDFLLSGDEQGTAMIWNSSNISMKNEGVLENSLRTTLYPIVSAKWFKYKPFSENYRFICLVQDCTAQLYQFQFADNDTLGRGPVKNKLKSKINLLCVLHLYDELKIKSPLWTYNVQSCDYLMLDRNSPAIGIVWPEKVSYKLSGNTKVTCLENELKIALLYDIQNPKVGNPLTSIPASLPMKRYIPGYDDTLKLEADAYIFYLDKNKQNVCSYCNSTGETKILFNIVKETDTHQNRYSKFEVRPKIGGGLYDTYRFLIRSEIDRQYNM